MKIYSYKDINYMESIKYYNYGIKEGIIDNSTCYKNIYKILPYIIENNEELLTCYKIGYCYVGGINSLVCNLPLKRHCVIINPLYEIIDINLPKYGKSFFKNFLSGNNVHFLVFAELNLFEFYSSIEENDYNLNLRNTLYSKEKPVWNYIYNNRLVTNDFVYNEYISNIK